MANPKEQMSLVVMDTFKGQENDDLRELCAKNNCEIVVIPHNLTNKFQPLDLSVKKAAKANVSSEKYGIWIASFFGNKTFVCQIDCRFVSLFES